MLFNILKNQATVLRINCWGANKKETFCYNILPQFKEIMSVWAWILALKIKRSGHTLVFFVNKRNRTC